MSDPAQQHRRQRDLVDSTDGLDLDRADAHRDGAADAHLDGLVAAAPDRERRHVGNEDLDLRVRPLRSSRDDDAEATEILIAINRLGGRL